MNTLNNVLWIEFDGDNFPEQDDRELWLQLADGSIWEGQLGDSDHDGSQYFANAKSDNIDVVRWAYAELTPDEEFEILADLLMKHLAQNHHPHVSLIATGSTCQLVEGIKGRSTTKYIRD